MSFVLNINFNLQANLAVQEARLSRAMIDLKSAQATLDEKQKQLDEVQVSLYHIYCGAIQKTAFKRA